MTDEQLQRGKLIESEIGLLQNELSKISKLDQHKAYFKLADIKNYENLVANFTSMYPMSAKDFINQYIFNINLQISRFKKELSEL